ncbi:hypothetical protein TNCV_3346831 [Trichonephila clavipes]|nr:hypothetical protein TNCV_3346831 [Trichonephila clavipes]
MATDLTAVKVICSQFGLAIPHEQTHACNGARFVAMELKGSNKTAATCHTARATIDLLKDTFGDRLISRFGPVNWPPRSCDLTSPL